MNIIDTFDNKWKSAILDVLSFFIKICDSNHLNYYAGYGTAIGAIRHKGFIPWDDDVDILMPRPDYEKFKTIFSELSQHEYLLHLPKHHSDYYLCYAKLSKSGTTLWESKNVHYTIGAFIDIFPLDGCSDDLQESVKYFNKYQKILRWYQDSTRYYTAAFYWKQIKRLNFLYLFRMFFSKCFKQQYRFYLLRKMSEIERLFPYETSKTVVVYSGYYGSKEFLNIKWFGKGILVDFENVKLILPIEYDEYLKHYYGDYMKLPPIKDQVTHHKVVYVDLNKGFDYKELKSFYKSL